MLSADDLLDICGDALTRDPDAAVAQPLFVARPVGERRPHWSGRGEPGVSQDYVIEGAGRYRVIVQEAEYVDH